MMPVTFEKANKIFKKPHNMTDEQCSDLPVWYGGVPIDDKGNLVPAIISCWKLSYEDLEEIQKTGCVWLSITGQGMPPVALFTENPFP